MIQTDKTPDLTIMPYPLNYNEHTHIEISKDAIDHNIHHYKNVIGHTNQLALVIKSNAYGHGLTNIGQIAQANNYVDWLCVAHYQEALHLIHGGVTKKILLLNYIPLVGISSVHNNIHFTIDSWDYAHQLNTIGAINNQKILVHIKIDTGLSRLGVLPDAAEAFFIALKQLSFIRVVGIFSHFIASDNNPDLTHKQFSLFSEVTQLACMHHSSIEYVHMSNTGSLSSLEYPSFFNLFRLGLGLYGFGCDEAFLKPALSWKTYIINIKTIPADSFVSYACTYKTSRETRVALLPIGYSDGYQLRFSNKTAVSINNTLAPVIGRVGMNITLVDVTNCSATVGDEVIIIGKQNPITLADIAHAAEIYNVREILTGLNPSIKRITQ